MEPMYLHDVEHCPSRNVWGEMAAQMAAGGISPPQIFHLFNFKPRATEHLARFTQEVMRGSSPLSAGQRELIAAFTSSRNQCPF